MNIDLATKYRPTSFDQLVGQDGVISSLKAMIDREGKLPPAVILHGDSGTGKTTLARILAHYVNCVDQNIIEVNASDKNSVDDMRELIELASFVAFGSNKTRVIILDEAHMLSKSAWNSLLKPIEEPAAHNTWIFCSTDPSKIPDAIQTRCTSFELKGVSPVKIKALLDRVVKEEGFTTPNNIVTLVTMSCKKSPRRALKQLEMLHSETDIEKAKEILKSYDEDSLPSVQALGRLIMNSGSFLEALGVVRKAEEPVEGIRLGLIKYFTTVCTRSDNIEKCKKALYVLNAFSKTYHPAEGMAPLLISLAEVLIAE